MGPERRHHIISSTVVRYVEFAAKSGVASPPRLMACLFCHLSVFLATGSTAEEVSSCARLLSVGVFSTGAHRLPGEQVISEPNAQWTLQSVSPSSEDLTMVSRAST